MTMLAVVSLFPALLLTSAMPIADPAREPGPKDLVLTLDAGKGSVSLYEPVVLEYRVSNPTASPIRSRVRMRFDEGRLSVQLQDDRGRTSPFHTGPFSHVVDLGEGTILEPGEALSADVVIFHNSLSRAPAFLSPGRYAITAQMITGYEAGAAIRIEARPVSIQVVPPSPADREAIDFLGSDEELIDLFTAGARRHCIPRGGETCYARLRELIARFPDSVYAPSVAFELATAYAELGRRDRQKVKDAIELLSDMLARWERHPLAADATTLLISALDAAGRTQELIDWLDRFEQLYPDRASRAHSLRQRVRPVVESD